MRAGANDYIIKGNLARLTPAFEREIRVVITLLLQPTALHRFKWEVANDEYGTGAR